MPAGGASFQDCPQTALADQPVSPDGEQEHKACPAYGVAERAVRPPHLIATLDEQPDRDTQQQAPLAYHEVDDQPSRPSRARGTVTSAATARSQADDLTAEATGLWVVLRCSPFTLRL